MSTKRYAIIGGCVALLIGIGGYGVGASTAPTPEEAAEVERDRFRDARERALRSSFVEAKARGLRAGAKKGRDAALRKGRTAGGSAGSSDADIELAAIAEEEAAKGIPSDLAPGEYLPPIPPGATEPNPTELCNQAPISAAALGYSCP